MKKRIYLVLETEADEDDNSILNDIEQELGMATHYFETVSYSENGFPDKWISVKDSQPKHHTPVLAFCDNGDTFWLYGLLQKLGRSRERNSIRCYPLDATS